MGARTLLSLAQPQSCCMRMMIPIQLHYKLPCPCMLAPTHARTQDVQWLGLTEGVDFAGMVDLAGVYRVFNTQYNSWTIFGQDHVVRDRTGQDPVRCGAQRELERSTLSHPVCGPMQCTHARIHGAVRWQQHLL